MHSDQLSIPVAHVRELVAQQFPQFADQEVVALETAGTVNAIFRIGTEHTARFPLRMMDPAECLRLLEREAAASTEFAQFCPFDSPEPVGIGQPGSRYPLPWLVQTWVEGEMATPVGSSSSLAFALDLAELVRAIGNADVSGRVFDGVGRGGSLTDHDRWMETCFVESERLLDVALLRRMWAGFRELPPASRVVMSHKDLTPPNLLIRDGRLAGVLDTGGFGPADPSLDLVAGWHLLDRDARTAFHAALESTELEQRRGAAWAFQQAMGLVWYYRETNPVMSELGRTTISRLIEDYQA